MATQSAASQTSTSYQPTTSQPAGVVKMETLQEETKKSHPTFPTAAKIEMTGATTNNASLEPQQQQQPADPVTNSLLNNNSNNNNNTSSSSVEKDESKMIATATMTTGFQKNYCIHKVIRVKKKTAVRPSLHEFFKKAAMAAAARQQQQQRPATRHGGRRENTNIFTATTGTSLIQKKKKTKPPRFLADGAAANSSDIDAAGASSSVKSHSSGGGGSSSNSRKRKNNGSTADHNQQGSNQKHLKVAPSTETTHTHRVDHPEVATIQPKTNDSTSTSIMMMIDATSHTAASQQAESLHNDNNPAPVGKTPSALASAKLAAVGLAGLTQQEIVELSYRPDSATESDFPVIPLPRATDVVMGRGSRVAKHHGNILFRGIVRTHKKRYSSSHTKRSEKHEIAQEVVEMVVQSGGRFLELAEEFGGTVLTGPWRHASYSKCVEKSSQALREQKWHHVEGAWSPPTPSPTGISKIPVEDPESLPPPPPPASRARSVTAIAQSTTPETRSRSPAVRAKTGTTPTSRGGAASSRQHKNSSSESSRSKNNTTTTTTTQRGEGHGSFDSIKEQHQQQAVVANKEIIVDNNSRTAEEQMQRLQDGSRVAIYWPLDAAYYEGTVEERLQDNFFYVRYDDGESEWLDLNKHAFKVLAAPSPAPVPARAPVSAPLAATAGARATTKVAAKKNSSNKKASSRDKKASSSDKKESSKKEEANVKQQGGGGMKKATTGKVPSAKRIRSSAQRSKQILDSIAKHGSDDWELVASEVPGWSAEDCRRRYELFLDPTLSKEPFTEDELREIMLLQSEHGNDWTSIAPNLTIPRSCVLLSDKWNRKVRNIILPHLLNLGLTRKQIDGDDDKKRINYHGHFEEVLAVVAASQI